MFKFVRRLSSGWQWLLSLILAAGILVAPNRAGAAFILDDFDDPASVVSPEMEGDLIETEDVGSLNATRTLLIFANRADPDAALDANITSSSHLTGVFNALNATPGSLELGHMGFSYRLENGAVDFTENGSNSAFLIDFLSIGGPTPPPLMHVLVHDADKFFETYVSLTTVTGASELAIPFDWFVPRGGGASRTDFKAISEVFFRVFSNGLINGVQEQGWNFQLERVRVGNVPEPTTAFLCVVAGLFVAFWRWPYRACTYSFTGGLSDERTRTGRGTSGV
jgi:hypothetical protein